MPEASRANSALRRTTARSPVLRDYQVSCLPGGQILPGQSPATVSPNPHTPSADQNPQVVACSAIVSPLRVRRSASFGTARSVATPSPASAPPCRRNIPPLPALGVPVDPHSGLSIAALSAPHIVRRTVPDGKSPPPGSMTCSAPSPYAGEAGQALDVSWSHANPSSI